jgi:hypothetical protein
MQRIRTCLESFVSVALFSACLPACSAAGGPPPSEQAESIGTGGASFETSTGGTPFQATGGDMGSGGALAGSAGTPTGTGGAPPVGAPDPNLPFAGYDPTVTFDWPEATATGSCKAGHYTGSFSGMYASGLTFVGVPIPVAGNLDLTLAESADGEFFTISGGKLSGVADGLFPFSADVSGTLDCKKAELVDGKLSNGIYDLGVQGVQGGTFEGPFPATYDKLTSAFTGTWKVYEPKMTTPPPIYGGSGDWNAHSVSP